MGLDPARPKRTPGSIEPSVTPVAANITSPAAMSSMVSLRSGSAMPILIGALALLRLAQHQAPLHLPADAAQRRGREHAFGRAADADVDVDPGFLRVGGMDDARRYRRR
jgi:hypothetical protein